MAVNLWPVIHTKQSLGYFEWGLLTAGTGKEIDDHLGEYNLTINMCNSTWRLAIGTPFPLLVVFWRSELATFSLRFCWIQCFLCARLVSESWAWSWTSDSPASTSRVLGWQVWTTWLLQCWGLNPGLERCFGSALPMELYPQPTLVYVVNFFFLFWENQLISILW